MPADFDCASPLNFYSSESHCHVFFPCWVTLVGSQVMPKDNACSDQYGIASFLWVGIPECSIRSVSSWAGPMKERVFIPASGTGRVGASLALAMFAVTRAIRSPGSISRTVAWLRLHDIALIDEIKSTEWIQEWAHNV